jgi:hypothetical protein
MSISMQSTAEARLTIAAEFPRRYFLENLAVRHDNSILVTVANRKELHYAPPPRKGVEVKPQGDCISKQGQESGKVGFVPTGSLELAAQ